MPKTGNAVPWTLLMDIAGHDGVTNMARDYALLCEAQRGVAFLRLYTWQPACLSFGRNEPARRRYDKTQIETQGIDTVRRPTGGRAVWHDRELTYAVTAPITTFGTLANTYVAIHQCLGDALRDCGYTASFANRRRVPGLGSGPCFDTPVGGELLVDGVKVVGSAQVREGDAFLQHGSIVLASQQDRLLDFRSVSHPRTLPPPVAPLAGLDIETLAFAIANHAQTSWLGEWQTEKSSNFDRGSFMFGDSAWTWRR